MLAKLEAVAYMCRPPPICSQAPHRYRLVAFVVETVVALGLAAVVAFASSAFATVGNAGQPSSFAVPAFVVG